MFGFARIASILLQSSLKCLTCLGGKVYKCDSAKGNKLWSGKSISKGLSQFSSDENVTAPFLEGLAMG
jgi:hypothetical protein